MLQQSTSSAGSILHSVPIFQGEERSSSRPRLVRSLRSKDGVLHGWATRIHQIFSWNCHKTKKHMMFSLGFLMFSPSLVLLGSHETWQTWQTWQEEHQLKEWMAWMAIRSTAHRATGRLRRSGGPALAMGPWDDQEDQEDCDAAD